MYVKAQFSDTVECQRDASRCIWCKICKWQLGLTKSKRRVTSCKSHVILTNVPATFSSGLSSQSSHSDLSLTYFTPLAILGQSCIWDPQSFPWSKKCSSSTLLIFPVVLLLHVIRPASENFGNLTNLKVPWFWVELQSPKKVFFFHTFQWLHFLFRGGISLPTYLQNRRLALVCPYQDEMWKIHMLEKSHKPVICCVDLCSLLWPRSPN